MNGLNQNDLEWLKDKVDIGKVSAAQANVELVKMARFRIVTAPLPRDVRASLNTAVKNGELGHMKKDGFKPEVYYHPTFKYMAKAERERIAKEAVQGIAKCFAPPDINDLLTELDKEK